MHRETEYTNTKQGSRSQQKEHLVLDTINCSIETKISSDSITARLEKVIVLLNETRNNMDHTIEKLYGSVPPSDVDSPKISTGSSSLLDFIFYLEKLSETIYNKQALIRIIL